MSSTVTSTKLSPSVPTEVLELEAAEQRRRIHSSVAEFRTQLRRKLDLRSQLREHLWPAAGLAAAVSLLLGFTSGRRMRQMIG